MSRLRRTQQKVQAVMNVFGMEHDRLCQILSVEQYIMVLQVLSAERNRLGSL